MTCGAHGRAPNPAGVLRGRADRSDTVVTISLSPEAGGIEHRIPRTEGADGQPDHGPWLEGHRKPCARWSTRSSEATILQHPHSRARGSRMTGAANQQESVSGRLPRNRGSDPPRVAPTDCESERAFGGGAGGAVSHDAAGNLGHRPSRRRPGSPATRGTAAGLPLNASRSTGARLGDEHYKRFWERKLSTRKCLTT